MMMLALHSGVDLHFRIRIISLANVSLWVLGSLAHFPPRCTKASLMVLGDCRRSFINLYLSVVEEDRLFIELMHISKASDILSWRWTFLVAVFFAVIFFVSSISLVFADTCLHCSTLTSVSYIPEVESGFLLVLASSFASFTFLLLSIIIVSLLISWIWRTVRFCTVSYAAARR